MLLLLLSESVQSVFILAPLASRVSYDSSSSLPCIPATTGYLRYIMPPSCQSRLLLILRCT